MKLDNRNRNSGGIEGLPLQLMIMIIVATMGTAIIVGWMGDLQTPQSIGDVDVDPGQIVSDGSTLGDITITVTDQDGTYLEGATVYLNGLNIRMNGEKAFGTTDANGSVTFSGLTIDPVGGGGAKFIDVLVSKSGYGEHNSAQIIVII